MGNNTISVKINVDDLPEVKKMLDQATDKINQVYWERGQLVAYLARQFDSHIVDQTGNDDWPVICIHSPKGQLTWHIPRGELVYYAGIQVSPSDYDGHTTEEKYARLWELTSA